jgi:hypothetical protein
MLASGDPIAVVACSTRMPATSAAPSAQLGPPPKAAGAITAPLFRGSVGKAVGESRLPMDIAWPIRARAPVGTRAGLVGWLGPLVASDEAPTRPRRIVSG